MADLGLVIVLLTRTFTVSNGQKSLPLVRPIEVAFRKQEGEWKVWSMAGSDIYELWRDELLRSVRSVDQKLSKS